MKKVVVPSLLLAIVLFSGCIDFTTTPTSTSQSHNIEQRQTSDNQLQLIQNQPAPSLTKSLERENLIKRLELLNDENKEFYVYLLSYGKIVAFFTAQGKVTSLNTYLTNYEQIVKSDECIKRSYDGSGTSCFFAVEAPDLDGTYGSNADGVFFFTTDGAYVEWKGEYLVSDFPLKISNPVELVKQI